ncbi:hypothetical protein [Citricoccus sp. GCM10030269]|uniref:hypothetical protein n=1 Tax=Citricoccus sp. GCM10030269 TaxID=3273388 RepID=UPI003620A8A9
MTEQPEQNTNPSTDPAATPGSGEDQSTTSDPNLVAAGTPLPEGQPQPPSERISPLVFLAIEQALEFASEEGSEAVEPFLLGYIDEEQKGMWKLPGADEDQMRAQISQLEPRPEMAVSVFDARLEVENQPHDAFVLEAFDNAEPISSTIIQLYTPAGADGEKAQAVGSPQLFTNGENVLRA